MRLGVVALVAVAAHLRALGGGFVWLDHAHLEQGLAIAAPSEWASLLSSGFAGTGFYRPLTALSLSVDSLLGGSPLVYHATTLGWHVAASVMVTVAASALGIAAHSALASGLLFAVHPVTSLVAAAIAFRSESMMTALLLAMVTLHVRGRPVAAALTLLGATLCKETALALSPLMLGALSVEVRRRSADPGRRRPGRLLVAEAAALVVALLLRLRFAPAWRATFPDLSVSEAVGTRLAALAKSATALVPVGIWDRTLCDAFPVTPMTSLAALTGGLVAVGVGWLAFRRGGPAALLALSLLPCLHLAPIMRWWSPHYLYLPLAFAAMLVGELLGRTLRRPVAWASVASMLLAVQTYSDDARFASDTRLWTREVRLHPECREGQFHLAEVARASGTWEVAAARYAQAIRETPGVLSFVDLQAALTNLGATRLAQQQPTPALEAFRSALGVATEPVDRRELECNVAAAELMAGDPVAALRRLEGETTRPDALSPCLVLAAQAQHALGHEDIARELLRRAGPPVSPSRR